MKQSLVIQPLKRRAVDVNRSIVSAMRRVYIDVGGVIDIAEQLDIRRVELANAQY